MTLICATLAAAALLPGAFAIPADDGTAMHRALQTTVDANGDHHLYFHTIDPLFRTCGQVDAAPLMPPELFEPENIAQLFLYVTVTRSLYTNPNPRATPLAVGECTNTHNVGGAIYKPTGGSFLVPWFGTSGFGTPSSGSLMGPVCAEYCGCDFQGLGPAHLPACTDAPDDPAKGEFCSLCGPTTACPGCTGQNGDGVTVQSFRQCPDPYRPAWNDEWCDGQCLDIECDDLPKTRQYCGGVFPEGCREVGTAPDATAMHRSLQVDPNEDFAAQLRAATTVDANGDHHLWFRSTDPALGWCGEIDAAAYMPADIFKPRHFLNLVAYAQLTLNTYVNPNKRATALVLGQCSGINYSRYGGQLTGVSWFGDGETSYGRFGRMMGSVCAVQCACSFRGNGPGALPACIDLPDRPSSGQFCSLCGPSTACGSAGCTDDGGITSAAPIHIYKEGPAECEPRGSACPPSSPAVFDH